MIPFSIGVALAFALILFGKLTEYQNDRSFFPTILIIIASYYVLFAISAESNWTLLIEIAVALFFSVLGIWAGYRIPMVVGAAIALHGFFDFVHGYLYENTGVPIWWPAFCAGIDIPFGLWVMYFRYKTRNT